MSPRCGYQAAHRPATQPPEIMLGLYMPQTAAERQLSAETLKIACLKRGLTIKDMGLDSGMRKSSIRTGLRSGRISAPRRARLEELLEFTVPLWSTARELMLRKQCVMRCCVDPAQLSAHVGLDFARKLGIRLSYPPPPWPEVLENVLLWLELNPNADLSAIRDEVLRNILQCRELIHRHLKHADELKRLLPDPSHLPERPDPAAVDKVRLLSALVEELECLLDLVYRDIRLAKMARVECLPPLRDIRTAIAGGAAQIVAASKLYSYS